MKLANSIRFRVFVYPEDDLEEIKSSFFYLLGYSEDELLKEKIKYSEIKAKGFNEKKIVIFEAVMEKDRHCNKFLGRLNEYMNNRDKEIILKQKNRLDDNLNFFLRFDKEKMINGDFILTDSGNCFHITINVSAFPKKKSIAFDVIKLIFQ